MSTLACPRCTPKSWRRRARVSAQPVLEWRYMTGGRVHLGAYCPRCGRWIKWVSQTDEWLAEAPPLVPAWGAK